VHALFGQPPQPRSLHDFDVLSSGWATQGVGVHAFGALVREKWREWDEGRGKAAAARKHKERERQKASAALLVWLTDLELDELHSLLVREGVDLSTLQYVTEADLSALGVTQLAQRRKLLAAVKTQEQYRHLTATIAALEEEASSLREAHQAQTAQLDATSAELQQANALSERLAAELAAERQGREGAEDDQQRLAEQLGASQEAVAALEAKAAAFAADIESLLGQVHASTDGQKQQLLELRKSIDLETINLKDRVRTGQGPRRAADGSSRRFKRPSTSQSTSSLAAAGAASAGAAAGPV